MQGGAQVAGEVIDHDRVVRAVLGESAPHDGERFHLSQEAGRERCAVYQKGARAMRGQG